MVIYIIFNIITYIVSCIIYKLHYPGKQDNEDNIEKWKYYTL